MNCARAADRDRAAELAEGVVVEARQDVALFRGRAQPLEEAMLRAVMHDPVGARDEQLGRHRDGARVRHHALGRLVEAEQDVDRDRPGDQRIGPERGDALRVVGEELRLDVGVDEEVAAIFVLQREAGARERHVELHLEGRRRQHHAADLRRIVVRPDRHQHRADALRDHRHLLDRDAVGRDDMLDEGLYVAHRGADARAEASLTG